MSTKLLGDVEYRNSRESRPLESIGASQPKQQVAMFGSKGIIVNDSVTRHSDSNVVFLWAIDRENETSIKYLDKLCSNILEPLL